MAFRPGIDTNYPHYPGFLIIQIKIILVIQVVIIIRIQFMIILTMMLMIFQGKYLNKLQHILQTKIKEQMLQGALLLCRWNLLTKGTVMPLLHGVTLKIIPDLYLYSSNAMKNTK